MRFLTNSSGSVTDSYTLDAFGMLIASTGTTSNNFRYDGEWLDTNLSFYNLRARYYNPLTGRFETMDLLPVSSSCCGPREISDPQTLHEYVFAKNNPLNRIDPKGTADFEEEDFSYLNTREYLDYVKTFDIGAKQARCLRYVKWYMQLNPGFDPIVAWAIYFVCMQGASAAFN